MNKYESIDYEQLNALALSGSNDGTGLLMSPSPLSVTSWFCSSVAGGLVFEGVKWVAVKTWEAHKKLQAEGKEYLSTQPIYC